VGGASASFEEMRDWPWHWTRATEYVRYVESIYEAAGLDMEGLVLPREYWFRKEEARTWYKDREEARREQ